MPRRALLLAMLGLLAAGPVDAGVVVTGHISTGLGGVVAPVLLEPGEVGATTVGANATSATTTLSGRAATGDVLTIRSGSATARDVRLVLLGGSLSGVRALALDLDGAPQIRVANGAATLAIGSAVALPPGGAIEVGASTRVERGGTAELTIGVEAWGPGGVALVETWVVRLRG